MRSRYTITLAVVTAAIMTITVCGSEKKLPAKKPTEQTAAPAESHDEEAVIQQPLAGAFEVKNGKQNQRAALAAQPSVAAAAGWQPYADRYAIIVMSDGRNSDEYFWPATKSMYSYLLEIGFSNENIRFLAPSKYATGHPDIVSGEASETRIEQAYQWARSVCTQEDLLYVYWISHGTSSYFTTAGNSVRHSTLASWMEGIKAKQIIGVYQPCQSGAVVDDISGKNIITVTSTDPTTVNDWCWGENIAFALAGPPYCDQWMSPGHKLEPARYHADQDGDGQVSVTEAYIWVAKHRYTEGSMFDDNGDGVGGQWMTDTFDPHDPGKDGCIGNHYSLIGWKPSSITLARKIVDELYEKEGLYYNVIAKLKADKNLDEPVSKVALKIANSRKWQDAERLAKEGWEIVSSADKDIDAYKSVLEKAKKVAGLEPRTPSILTTLGVGQYRLGAYADALDTLKQAEKMRTDSNLGPDPNSAAFTAMTQYQLGQIDEGRSAINAFRDMLEKITFADITSGKLSHWIEAEKVFAGNNNEILAIWELIGTKEFDRAVETFTELQHTTKETDSQFTFSSEGIARYLSRICYIRGKSRVVGEEPAVPDMMFDGEPNSFFGLPIACGDVDGDGYDDILIGAGNYNNNRGRVCLFYGGPDMDTTPDLILEGQNEGDLFGSGIGCGDIDNDGYEDIVIAAGGYSEKRGRAYLYWGSDRNSMDANPDKIFAGEAEKGSHFGLGSPAVYDIDNDGYDDIILGAFSSGDGTGRAYLYYGNTKELMDTSHDLIFTGENPRDQFGYTISCGDVDNDGYGDIVIGPYARQGRTYLYYGGSKSNMDAKAEVIFEVKSEGADYFGQGIVCVDQNRDGYDDVVIGAPAYNDRQGRAYLFHGNSKRSLDADPDMIFDDEVVHSNYGVKEVCGDIDGDNVNDIVIGASGFGQRVGRVYVYWGNELSGPNPKPGRILTGEYPKDGFGYGLACGDVNNDGFDDLVIGAYGYKAGEKQGRAYLYYGGPLNK